MIYLDNAATTPVLPAVSQVMLETLNTTFGNPSSIHSYGRSAGKIIREARKTIATILDVPARNLISSRRPLSTTPFYILFYTYKTATALMLRLSNLTPMVALPLTSLLTPFEMTPS